MTTLEQQILSSRQQVTGYAIMPYMASTARPEYDVRYWSPAMVAPVVDTQLHTTAIAGRSTPDIPKVQVAVNPINFDSGAARVRSNSAGVMGGAR